THTALGIGPGTNDVWTAVGIQHVVPSEERAWRSREDVVNETHLPSFQHARQPSGSFTQEELVGPDRQLDRTVGPEIASSASSANAVIHCRVQWIGKALLSRA